ncbi:thioester reductase domain-containing protein [Thecamonas trahens ATCC 50062]|uniref:Thioester reductase domain-containing protein n=1 Tax=Thecamonas trahens ATCC 50062 TaxID=461836 RepID=A0A0L0DE82_THETB|nr:thioester reductase domain-containing protein [Thecamonas trahens ATCC 50062]KNC50594.1 thioester reductase domain-containing protein [Thecamonas trahens ATCC 50062]|eukprot:XP_013762481.1 thioester reductase domain-containing protein [Thecamonas trahens ATCC 50062]
MSDTADELKGLTLDTSIEPEQLSATQLEYLRSWASAAHQSNKKDTLYASLYAYFGLYHDRPLLGTRQRDEDSGALGEYAFVTYAEVWLAAQALGSALQALPGITAASAAGNQPFIGLCSINRAEWVVADLACVLYSMVSVPLHVTLSAEAMAYIAAHSGITVVIVAAEAADKLLAALATATEPLALRTLVCMEGIETLSDDARAAAAAINLELLGYPQLVAAGAAAFVPHSDSIPPSAIHTIIYTSGSTGPPKGAVMTCDRWNKFITAPYLMPFPIIRISFAPFAHVAERQTLYITMACGGRFGFYTGDMDRIFDELALLRPTMFASVPRFYNLLYSKYQAALDAALAAAPPSTNPIEVDNAVVSSFSSVLGGRTQYIVTGSAPTSAEVKRFLRRAFACPLYDGFGTTEVGGIAVDNVISNNVDVRLLDLPHLGYTTADKPHPRGEICVKTPHMITSYYNNERATRSAFTSDGYFRTGDVGVMEADGQVRIIDRAKNVFKLANAEFCAPEGIENTLLASPLIDQLFVYGDPQRTFLVAVIVPNTAHAQVDTADPELAAKMLAELSRVGAAAHMPQYEIPAAVHLASEPFTPDNGLMTYSNKLARKQLTTRYIDDIEALYAAGPQRAGHGHNLLAAATQPGQGLDSMSAVKLSSLLQAQTGSVVAPSALLEAAARGDDVLAALLESPGSSAAAPDLASVVAADLGMDLNLQRCERKGNVLSNDHKTWFVTGGTGLIGSHVIRAVLALPDVDVIALVRGESHAAARARLTSVLTTAGVDEHALTRLSVLAGDLAEPQLGLDVSSWAGLVELVEVIVHSGAIVNWLDPYAALRSANVLGTAEVLRLAAAGSRDPTLVALSTVGTAGWTENDLQPFENMLSSSGYALSKWVAEQLVARALASGAIRGVIVRPGMVTGCSETGVCNPTDFVSRLMVGVPALGAYFDSDAVLDMTPVDFVAQVIVLLGEHGLRAGFGSVVFHLTNVARSRSYAALGRAIATFCAAHDPPRTLVALPYPEWRARLLADDGPALFPLRPFFAVDFSMGYRALDTSHTDAFLAWLAAAGIDHPTWPQIDDQLVARYLSWLGVA